MTPQIACAFVFNENSFLANISNPENVLFQGSKNLTFFQGHECTEEMKRSWRAGCKRSRRTHCGDMQVYYIRLGGPDQPTCTKVSYFYQSPHNGHSWGWPNLKRVVSKGPERNGETSWNRPFLGRWLTGRVPSWGNVHVSELDPGMMDW